MVDLDWETERADGVTLVRLYVTSEYRRRVRVESRLDGPVWPPRREGQPATGWDGDAFEGVVTPDDRLVAGFATPAPPEDPPAEVVSEDPADPDAPPGPAGGSVDPLDTDREVAATDGGNSAETSGVRASSDDPTPEDVVRSLGDPVVPREAVPVPGVPEDADDDTESASQVDATKDATGGVDGRNRGDGGDGEGKADTGPGDEAEPGGDGTEQRATREPGAVEPPGSPDGAAPPGTDAELVVPGAVRAWLRDVDRRLRAVERRQESERADPDPTLQIAVAGDRRALARVADRVETLAGRATAVERRAGSDGRR